MIWMIILHVLYGSGFVKSVEVHFETPDSGFFLKHSPRQSLNPTADITNNPIRTKDQDSILSIDRFTVVQTIQPVSIRASYGPFSTKQTVPARFIVPDAVDSTQSDHVQNATGALMELQQSNVHLDISAHLVRNTIPRDSPVIRVLFHAGADTGGHLQRQKICVLLHVSMGIRTPLKGRCMPEGEDGVCVAEVIIPSNWWPPLPPPDKDGRVISPKVPQRMVQVSYSVFEPPIRNPEQCEPKVQIQPLTPFAQVPLVAALTAYKELRADDTLTILIPHQPLYPMSRIHVPVFLQPQIGQNIAVFIVRARVKAGMRILGATASSDQWNVSVEKENPKHTVARVTAFRKDQDPDSPTKSTDNVDATQVIEVFTWLLEVANDTKEHWDGGRIVWSVSYVHDGPKIKDMPIENTNGTPEETRRKLVAKLEIQKDDIQAVLPISKNWELMNTAVLTGRQVSQAMKVFIVSQGGKIADVTLQSSCQAEDESVIKVSSSCSSVYVDGSEARGSSNASVIVKYGTYIGLAKFIVWMPEFPLEVSVADFRLSQIKGWKIPDDHHHSGKTNRRKRAYNWNTHVDDFVNGVHPDRPTCRAKYQQSPVEVYARFLAIDQDSGRVSYLISRRTGLRVTDLVQPLLRVADPKIALLKGRTLQGRAMGRTDVQVLSPITGRVIGAKEIRVGSDRVSITRLVVRVVSGLQLNITPDSAIENGYIAETSVTRKLTAQYQEGLLDIDLEFSDGAKTPLRDVSVDDYFLLVESLDTEVVAFAPMLASHHPRVIAVGEGNGDLLRVNLLLSEECRLRRNIPLLKQGSKSAIGPLASALASVQVDFNAVEPGRPDTVQNDGISGRERKGSRDSGDLADILIGVPLKDDGSHEPTVQARQHRGGLASRNNHPHTDMTSLEIGMYVLLTAFCFAIAVFVVSCVVYASRFKPVTHDVDSVNGNIVVKAGAGISSSLGIQRESRKPRESTTNAHDWVWLGRSTMDRSSVVQDNVNGNALDNQRNSKIRITSNPINLNYADPDDALVEVTCFDNPNHIQLPAASQNLNIDSSTYNKKDRRSNNVGDDPPPLPPHSTAVKSPQNGNNPPNKPEYRPPVPPHRNIGITANVSTVDKQISANPVPVKRYHHHGGKHRNNANALNRRSNGSTKNFPLPPPPPPQQQQPPPPPPPTSSAAPHQPIAGVGAQLNTANVNQHNLNLTQQQINAALFNKCMDQISSVNGYSSAYQLGNGKNLINCNKRHQQQHHVMHHHHNNMDTDTSSISSSCNELHMAEKLVESAAQQQKSVFQFDTIPQRKPIAIDTEIAPSTSHEDNSLQKPNTETVSSLEDNGGFVTPPPINDNILLPSSVTSAIISGTSTTSNNCSAQQCYNTTVHSDTYTTSSIIDNCKVMPSIVCNVDENNGDTTTTTQISPIQICSNNGTYNSGGEMGPTESLGLDDLDMDYEQIMHYFDNLKESNA